VYRLTKCPELTLGIFTLPILDQGEPKPRPELIAHIIATRTSSPRVTEAAMKVPADWQTKKRSLPDADDKDYLGHEDQGGTIALHSLAVKAEHQRKSVGSTLMKSYIQRIKEAAIADRIALLAHDHMVPFYQSLGFENYGPSACTFGGGGWFDMVSTFAIYIHPTNEANVLRMQILEFPKNQSPE
jgi:GNAT superfamily N-acetyltransferase